MFSLGIMSYSAAVALNSAYWMSQRNGGNATDVQKMVFANETTSTLTSLMPSGIGGNSAGASSATKGYSGGGYNTGITAGIRKLYALTFSNETVATLTDLATTTGRYAPSGTESSTDGYIIGGASVEPIYTASQLTAIDKIVFSNDTNSTLSSSNSYKMAQGRTVRDATNAWTCGGYSIDEGGNLTTISKLVFSTDTSAANANNLPAILNSPSGASASTAGYLMGGHSGGVSNVIRKVNFSNDTVSTPSATLSTATYFGGSASTATKGYAVGGYNGGNLNNIQTLTFSGETTGTAANNLQTAANGNTASVQY